MKRPKKTSEPIKLKRKVLKKKLKEKKSTSAQDIELAEATKLVKEQLVKRGLGASNAVSSEELDEVVDVIKTGKDRKGNPLLLTPAGMLWQAMYQVYGIDLDYQKFERFQQLLMNKLEQVTSCEDGQQDKILGEDFNQFFRMFVRAVNLAGVLKEKLDEAGIYFDLEQYVIDEENRRRGQEGDDYGEDNDRHIQ